jgi:hypothetical protein
MNSEPVKGYDRAAIGVRAVFPAKGYATFGEDSAVTNGGGSDISAQVLEWRGTGTGRLDMDAPSFDPHLWTGLPAPAFNPLLRNPSCDRV